MVKDLLKKCVNIIFSITDKADYRGNRIQICILGLKIKILKPEISRLRNKMPFDDYKRNKVDITTLPPITGQGRDVQLANLAILKEVDYICKKNDLKYWLDFGTLLGAVRHKGFIPWDDDIDLGMLREDHDKLIEIFENEKRNQDLYLEYYFWFDKDRLAYLLRVKHRKCPFLFVDIFPYYNYSETLSLEAQLEKTKDLKLYRTKRLREINPISKEEILSANDLIRKEIVSDGNDDRNDLIWGSEFAHACSNWFHKREKIFPLKMLKFEGLDLPCINDPEQHLTDIYGNYMSYPKKIAVGHNMFKAFSDEDLENIQSLIREKQ